MKLEGEYVFDGPREEVWEMVRDPEVLATALPGTQSLEQVGENEYAGKMHVRIGPVSGVFAGKIVVSDEVPPESYTLAVDGRGAPGFANGTGHVQLFERDDGKTLMQYEGDMQVGGRLASVGQRLIDTASKSMIQPRAGVAEQCPAGPHGGRGRGHGGRIRAAHRSRVRGGCGQRHGWRDAAIPSGDRYHRCRGRCHPHRYGVAGYQKEDRMGITE